MMIELYPFIKSKIFNFLNLQRGACIHTTIEHYHTIGLENKNIKYKEIYNLRK